MIDTAPPASLPARLQRVTHLAQRELAGEVVVLDLREGRLFGFNPEGGALLDRLRDCRATEELCGTDPATREFVRSICALGLVVPTEAASIESPPLPPASAPPRLLWQEEAARVTHQISPPQMITNPQCQP